MTETAAANPNSAYRYAGEELRKDIDFIKHIYSLNKKIESAPSLYAQMPDELRKNEEMAVLAIENNDYESLDAMFADSPVIWEKIIDKMVDERRSE